MHTVLKTVFYLTALAALPAHAQTPQPLWEIGAVGVAVSQQAYPGANHQTKAGLVAPYVIYRGDLLRVSRDGIGLRALKTNTFELDLSVAAALGSNSNAIPVRQGMPNLGALVEFGPNAKWYLSSKDAPTVWRIDTPLRGVFNLSRQLQYEGLTFEPALAVESKPMGKWRYSANVGMLLGDARTNDLFYGVSPAYANASRPAYAAKGGLIAYKVGASVTYTVSPDISIFGFARLNTVSASSNHASPLIQKNGGASYGIGMVYVFSKSAELTRN